MADIFVSCTSSDRDWAFWIAKELAALGHSPRVHEWEINRGDDIYAWMEQRHEAADHVLCVVSDDYLKAPYSTLERNAAIWQAAPQRPGFVLMWSHDVGVCRDGPKAVIAFVARQNFSVARRHSTNVTPGQASCGSSWRS